MTQVETLEIIGKQLLQTSKEIAKLIGKEDYAEIENLLPAKEELIRKYINAKKTTELTAEQENFFLDLEKEIKAKEQENISLLTKLRHEGDEELSSTKSKIKINSAYTIQIEEQQGQIFDLEE